MKTNYLINPFERIAGWPALLIGLCIMALTAVFGSINHVVFDGALDIHASPDYGFAASLIMQAVDFLALFLSIWLAGVCFSKTRIRTIDVAGTVALSRMPMLLLAIISFLPIVPSVNFVVNEHGNWEFIRNIPMIHEIIFITVCLLATIWMITLMYHAFSVSCRVKGIRGVIFFIGALLVAEVISKCVIIFLLSGILSGPGVEANNPAPVVGTESVADTAAIRLNTIHITNNLQIGYFDAIVACFDETMKQNLSADNLEKIWQQYTGPLGNFEKFDWTNVTKTQQEPYEIMEIPCIFDKGKITLRLVFNKNGAIGGLFIK